MNRFLKPVLAGATLLTLAVPALASAQPYDGGRTYAARGDYSNTSYGPYAGRSDFEHAGHGDFVRRDRHERWDRGDGYRSSWRWGVRHRHHHHWGEARYDSGWR